MTSNIDRVPFVSNRKARGCSAELFMGSFRVKLAFNPCIRVPHTKSFHEPPSYDASLRCDDVDQTCLVLQFLLFACGVCAWPQKHWPQILGPKHMMHIFHRIWPISPISYNTSEKQLPPPGLVPKILPGNSPPITTYRRSQVMMALPRPRMCHEFFFVIAGIFLTSSQCCLGSWEPQTLCFFCFQLSSK